MLHHEAVALLQLHSQAVAVNNIRNHVTTILDVDSGNFSRWCDQFLLILGKFSLQDHVREDPPDPISPDWARMDCVVKSWIIAMLTDDLGEIISARGSTTRHAWLAVESQFLGNREARSIQLETRFRNFVQGDLSITEYCRKLKKMADDLTALGEVISDRTLVLNVIRGLNERFSHVGTLLRRAKPFPTFLEAREDLVVEELTMENRKEAPAATLAASTTTTPAPASSGPGSGGTGGSSKAPNNRRSKRGGGGKGHGNNSSSGQGSRPPGGTTQQQQQATGQQQQTVGGRPWPSFYNPWSGTIQMWPGGPRPPLAPIPVPPHLQAQHQAQQQAQQQALLAQQQQQALAAHQQAAPIGAGPWVAPGFYNPMTGLPSWDLTELAAAFSTTSLTPPSSNEWYFDTGSSNSERDRQV
ncbi:uncharacterized protein LOC110433093 [Sorghum bicolor]|uniref:uncharacterized protein LOC110433093 n=1 Tax=Sorghum bicolor TaxID=4558 RepID=UPI000B425B21|nr:uncharacterized protein LOC110433093 [Sorghum bicolor]|eukprot:XP_021310400.1 uncharacterized protein LOC110433093 [Sorghum bicolor]